MNHRVTGNNIAQQDSIQDANNINISQTNQSTTIKVDKPQILSIPETPKRFSQPQRVAKPITKPKIFTASPDDSIAFNLKVRKESDNILEKTLVNDYLNPIPLSDRIWLTKEISNVITQEPAITSPEVISNEDSLSVVQDTINVKDTPAISIADSTKNSELSPVHFIQDSVSVTQSQDSVKVYTEVPVSKSKNEARDTNKDIISGLLILAVAITGFLRVTNYKYLRDLFSALIYNQEARKMQKTVNLHNQTPSLILNGLFLLNISIFIYQIVNYYQIKTIINQSILLIPIFMALIIIYGLIKVSLYRFVAFVFETTQETKEYLFFNFLHNKVFAIAILPIIIVVPYIEPKILPLLFKIGGFIFISLYFIQLFRGFTIILKNLASLLYLFLYLCALEILPLIIVYKILIK